MPRDEELPIIRAFYDFVFWLNPKIAKFPRDQRFVLGERMERQLFEVLEDLIRAKYTRSRRAILDQVNLGLEILRFQIRLTKDFQYWRLSLIYRPCVGPRNLYAGQRLEPNFL